MNDIQHFGVRVDDVQRAMKFYESVFGWSFEAWGPPGFYMIRTSGTPGAISGSMWKREVPYNGDGFCAFECTITVEDLDKTANAVVEFGGSILFEKSVIKGVGELIRFKDPESNILCAMRYDPSI
jgi:predicted enzyme related to lactoylglutathione lyase